MKTLEEILKEFDEKFGKIGPEGNCDSIGRGAGCDDCFENIKLREEHRKFITQAYEAGRERVNEVGRNPTQDK